MTYVYTSARCETVRKILGFKNHRDNRVHGYDGNFANAEFVKKALRLPFLPNSYLTLNCRSARDTSKIVRILLDRGFDVVREEDCEIIPCKKD